MGRKIHSDTVKAVVLAALETGTSSEELERIYKIPAGTIRNWKADQKNAPVAIVATARREEVGELLVEFLRESVRTLQIQVRHFGDKEWLAKQTASEASQLFGTVTDRAFRLLEALEAGAEPEEPTEQGS